MAPPAVQSDGETPRAPARPPPPSSESLLPHPSLQFHCAFSGMPSTTSSGHHHQFLLSCRSRMEESLSSSPARRTCSNDNRHHPSPILTLTLSPQQQNDSVDVAASSWGLPLSPSSFDRMIADESQQFLYANTPPYSPESDSASSSSFFFPRTPTTPFVPGMPTVPRARFTAPRFSARRLWTYGKYGMTLILLIACLGLLDQSASNKDSMFEETPEPSTMGGGEPPRLRRALSVPANNIPQRDGPLFDLGDGYAASKGEDVLITVKTSRKYHHSRLGDILDTWFRLAPEKIYFITDSEDEDLRQRTGDRLISTTCPAGHNRQALCCKQSAEYETYLKHGTSWWCHFDDDNYVNVPQLMRTLSQYDPRQDWYLGKPSTKGPIETPYRDYGAGGSEYTESNERISFWFATGGAGFCVSKSLAVKMRPYAADGKFEALCDRIRLPDDVTIGYLIEVLLEKNLTVVPRFHSHLENMRSIDSDRLHEQVTLSAGSYDGRDRNLVNVDGFFPDSDDPRRFRSLHCHLYPMAAVCRSRRQRLAAAKEN